MCKNERTESGQLRRKSRVCLYTGSFMQSRSDPTNMRPVMQSSKLSDSFRNKGGSFRLVKGGRTCVTRRKGEVLMLRASSVLSLSLSVHSLGSTGFPFFFHQIHRWTHFELNKDSTSSGPKFWTCGRCWRWRRPLIQLRSLDLDVHDHQRRGRGIGDVWPEESSECTREVHHWR